MMRSLRQAAAVAVMVLGVAGAGFTETAPGLVPTFLIERITVEGLRHGPAGIVEAASLLRPGTAYTETELRQAVYRVERLPFVLVADFSLRKGSVRDTFELVIKVAETSTFFVGLEAKESNTSALFLRSDGRLEVESGEWVETLAPSLGARLFVGPYGEISAAASSPDVLERSNRDLDFRLAYTHHNLLGRSLVGCVAAARHEPATQWGSSATSLEASLIAPLGGDQALRGAFLHERTDYPGFADYIKDTWQPRHIRMWRGSLDWLLDSRDDPFMPRQGMQLTLGGLVSRTRYELRIVGEDGEQRFGDSSWTSRDMHVDGMWFLPLGGTQAFGVGGSFRHSWDRRVWDAGLTGFGRDDRSSRTWQGGLQVRHTVRLPSLLGREELSDWWLESNLQGRRDWSNSPTVTIWDSDSSIASIALAGRARWWTVRFQVAYAKTWWRWQ